MARQPRRLHTAHTRIAPHEPAGEGSSRLVHVLLVERDPMARRGMGQVLDANADLTVAGTVATIHEATCLRASIPVDVVLVGDDVLDMDGTDGILRLLTRFLSARVVVLLAEGSPEQVVGVLRQGADGVLPRDTPPDDLTRAVRGVIQEKVVLPQEWIRFLTDALRLGPLAVSIEETSFSPRERDVLTELGRGRSNTQIANRLGLKQSTVKTHVSSILSKTGARSRHALSTPYPRVQDTA